MSGKSKAVCLVVFCLTLLCSGASSALADDENILIDDGILDAELSQPASPENDAFEEAALPSPAEVPQPERNTKPQTRTKKASVAPRAAKVKTQHRHTASIPMPSPELLELPNKVLSGDNYDWLVAGLSCMAAFFFGFAFFLWRLVPKRAAKKTPKTNASKIGYWNLGHPTQS